MQTIIAIALLASAVGFMFWKIMRKRLFTTNNPQKADDCGPDCKCG